MSDEMASADLQRLLGINKSVTSELSAKGVLVRGKKRGSYRFESVTRYCEHLRRMAAGRGGEAGASRGHRRTRGRGGNHISPTSVRRMPDCGAPNPLSSV